MAKIGEGSLEAMARLGLKELRNAFNPSKDSIADSELGMYGTATQSQINDDRGISGSKFDSMDAVRGRVQAKEQSEPLREIEGHEHDELER